VPVIFVKGSFLGGFDDVNHLSATGELQNQYLNDLTQWDRCEKLMRKSGFRTEPSFWYPSTVNAHVIRAGASLTFICSITSIVTILWFDWGAYLAYFIFLDFLLRVLFGPRFSPFARVGKIFVAFREPKDKHGRPLQFAAMCGLLMSGLASVCFLLHTRVSNYVGVAFLGGITVAAGMASFLDFAWVVLYSSGP